MVAKDGSTQASAGFASPNFGHLAKQVPLLALHGVKAERFVFEEPDTALFKLRQFGEVLAQEVAASIGLYRSSNEPQVALLRRLRDEGVIDFEVADLFHVLRKVGNQAVHEGVGTQRDALHGLRIAWRLGVWFQQAFKDPSFKGGSFIPPPDPRQAERALAEELAELRDTLAKHEARVEHLEATAQKEAELRAHAAAQAEAAYRDLAVALELAGETEAKAVRERQEFDAKLEALQAQVVAAPRPAVEAVIRQAREATGRLELDESETRMLIDEQLRAWGWEADSVAITYRGGSRPTKGKHMAIAEWPTTTGPADYVLFAGLTPIGIVEAKRQAKDATRPPPPGPPSAAASRRPPSASDRDVGCGRHHLPPRPGGPRLPPPRHRAGLPRPLAAPGHRRRPRVAAHLRNGDGRGARGSPRSRRGATPTRRARGELRAAPARGQGRARGASGASAGAADGLDRDAVAEIFIG